MRMNQLRIGGCLQVSNKVKYASKESLETDEDLVQRSVDASKERAEIGDGRGFAKKTVERICEICDDPGDEISNVVVALALDLGGGRDGAEG